MNLSGLACEWILSFVLSLLWGARSRRHRRIARQRGPLRLHGRKGLRRRRLSPGVVQLPVPVLASFLKLIHALSQAPRQLRQLFRPEQDEHNEEDNDQIRSPEIPKSKCKKIHVMLTGWTTRLIPKLYSINIGLPLRRPQ